MLEKFGIQGWRDIEPVVLAAMVAKIPVLLIGTHGAAKTEGAVALVKAVAGQDASIQKYDVPNLQAEELLGYPNPSDLAAGREMTYISTPISIWGKVGVILDELNRASFMTQSKVVELVREGSVMGMDTCVEYVFAAVNPPEAYGSMYMELALASRFVCVQVPDMSIFTAKDLRAILTSEISSEDNSGFLGVVHKVRSSRLPKDDVEELQLLSIKIAQMLQSVLATSKNSPGYSARSMKMLYHLLEASEKLRRVSQNDYAKLVTPETLVNLVLSTIPEVWGITQKTTACDVIVTKIKELLASFKIGDMLGEPLVAVTDIEDFLDLPIPQDNALQWGEEVVTKIKEITNTIKLVRVRDHIVAMLEDIPESVSNSILLVLLYRMRSLHLFSLDFPLSPDGIQKMIKEAFGL